MQAIPVASLNFLDVRLRWYSYFEKIIMEKEIDIFGWKYQLSESEMQFIQTMMVITVMCLIIIKGLTTPLAYKLYGVSIFGWIIYFFRSFFS